MEQLPWEIQFEILDRLPIIDVFNLRFVSVYYYTIIRDYLMDRIKKHPEDEFNLSPVMLELASRGQLGAIKYILSLKPNFQFDIIKTFDSAKSTEQAEVIKFLLDTYGNQVFKKRRILPPAPPVRFIR